MAIPEHDQIIIDQIIERVVENLTDEHNRCRNLNNIKRIAALLDDNKASGELCKLVTAEYLNITNQKNITRSVMENIYRSSY